MVWGHRPTLIGSSPSGASAARYITAPTCSVSFVWPTRCYAPVVTRFLTYDVRLDDACAAYCERIMALPEMVEWCAAALREPDEFEELDMEF